MDKPLEVFWELEVALDQPDRAPDNHERWFVMKTHVTAQDEAELLLTEARAEYRDRRFRLVKVERFLDESSPQ